MKSKLILFLLSVFIAPMFITIADEKFDLFEKIPNAEFLLNNSTFGREFWIAIPPNELVDYPEQLLEIYVASHYKTEVVLESESMGVYVKKQVEPSIITTFTSENGEIQFNLEVRESEEITTKGLRLYSEHPFSVYVANMKMYSSEGYLAIPLKSLGTKNIHCSYYDHNEVDPWASGFLIVSPYDDNKVRISLNGLDKSDSGKTVGGRSIGDIIHVTLNKGQTYLVLGDGQTRGEFDLTGSVIDSQDPIGLVSFHERTHIPSYDLWSGRDHLSEMMIPVHTWGKKYVTVEYKRDSGKGDFFRIVASQDSTTFKCKYFDDETGEQLGVWEGLLEKVGDFDEFLQAEVVAGNKLKSINGLSVFEADKPVLLMQYSYSADWDGNDIFDPFMIIVTPEDQFTAATVFQTPTGKSFNNNWLNLVVKHDPDDINFTDLKSIQISSDYVILGDSSTKDTAIYTEEYLWVKDPKFLFNKIPGENMYWSKISVSPGSHRIWGKAPFGAYIYGFSNWDSYGWPAAMALNKIDVDDTTAPDILINDFGDNFRVTTREVVTIASKENNREKINSKSSSTGISAFELLPGTYNFDLEFLTEKNIEPFREIMNFAFNLNVIDKSKDAAAYFVVLDRTGNYNIDSVKYLTSSVLEENKDELAFSISPNPVDADFVIVTFTNNKVLIKTITLIDNNGSLIKDINVSAQHEKIKKIDISDLSQGIYFISVDFGEKTVTKKFIINR